MGFGPSEGGIPPFAHVCACVNKLFRKLVIWRDFFQNSFAGGPPLVDHKKQEQHPSQQGTQTQKEWRY